LKLEHTRPEGQSVVRTHCAQVPALHLGIAEGQSVSVLHATDATHRPSAPHTVPGRDAQLAFSVHGTQTEKLVLQKGVFPEHCESMVHPGMQVKAGPGLQIGRAAPQSALSRHATHRPVDAKHRGALAGQSESLAQATQASVLELQILLLPVQSLESVHPTHAPLESHFGVPCGHTVAASPLVQDGWH
jgi:hypothetical protein